MGDAAHKFDPHWRAKALDMFVGEAAEIRPSNIKVPPKPAPRWNKKKNPNGGWDVVRGNEVVHFKTHDEADEFLDRQLFPERFSK